MSKVASILENIPAHLKRGNLLKLASPPVEKVCTNQPLSDIKSAAEVWGSRLTQGRLPKGALIELALDGGYSLGTSLALRACKAAQKNDFQESPWVAFIDPSASLFAPGVAQCGVNLRRLLVVQPEPEQLERIILRIVESSIFPLVVIDLSGTPQFGVELQEQRLIRVIRRITKALEESERSVLLLTSSLQKRQLPLPVTQRIELTRHSADEFIFEVKKDRSGLICGPSQLTWSRPSLSITSSKNQAVAGISPKAAQPFIPTL